MNVVCWRRSDFSLFCWTSDADFSLCWTAWVWLKAGVSIPGPSVMLACIGQALVWASARGVVAGDAGGHLPGYDLQSWLKA